jgi:hypothetical protein
MSRPEEHQTYQYRDKLKMGIAGLNAYQLADSHTLVKLSMLTR